MVLGLASSGLHSNGFSLVRRVVETLGLDYSQPAPFAADRPLGEALLTPTRIYVKSCLAALEVAADGARGVKALAHITGGGFLENLPRVIPESLGVVLDGITWPVPEVFRWLADFGGIAPQEMVRTFNCGVGMAVVVDPRQAEAVRAAFEAAGEMVFTIGHITAHHGEGGGQVTIENLDQTWPQ